MNSKREIITKCRALLEAYRSGDLGYMKMPEDASPQFLEEEKETRLTYFTLPMSLNYQRDSYKLWESALKTFNDPETKAVFNIQASAFFSEERLRTLLTKYKLALQPNKHIDTWRKIAQTVFENWGSIKNLFYSAEYNFLKLRNIVQERFKKGFPYLSGPKIFNYWSFVIQKYGQIELKDSEFIEIAPDTHVTKCSVLLGVINQGESQFLTKEEISQRWRQLLSGTGINPIDMHSPLWFWSRNNFQFKLE